MIVAGASAYPRIIDFERLGADRARRSTRCCSSTWRTSPVSSRPGCTRARSRTPTSSRPRPTRRCADRAAASSSAAPSSASRSTRPSSRALQGGPLMHVIAAKAVALKLAATDEFRRDMQRTVDNAQVLADDARRARREGRLGRHGQPPDAGRRHAARRHRPRGRDAPRRARHHGQQERHPVRPAAAQHGVGHPRRHAGHHDARLRRRTRCARGRADRARHRAARRRAGAGRLRARRCATSAPASRCRACPRSEPGRLSTRCPFILAALVAAAAVSFLLTPLTIRFAGRLGAIDVPDDERRVHSQPIPRTGGLAVALAFVGVGALGLWPTSCLRHCPCPARPVRTTEVAALFVGVAVRRDLRLHRRPVSAPRALAVHGPVRARRIASPAASDRPHPQSVRRPIPSSTRRSARRGSGGDDAVDRGHDQQRQLHRRARRSVDGRLAHRRHDAGRHLARRPLRSSPWWRCCARCSPARCSGSCPGTSTRRACSSARPGCSPWAMRWRCCRSSARPRSRWRCSSSACRSSTPSGSSSAACPQGRSPFDADRGHFHHRLLDLGLTHRQAVLLIYAICVVLAVLSLVLSARARSRSS